MKDSQGKPEENEYGQEIKRRVRRNRRVRVRKDSGQTAVKEDRNWRTDI